MNNHPHGIHQLTVQHSQELLSDGHRRQLAKESRLRKTPELGGSLPWAHRSVSRVSALIAAVASLLPAPGRRRAPTEASRE